jgi:hypothetical protein
VVRHESGTRWKQSMDTVCVVGCYLSTDNIQPHRRYPYSASNLFRFHDVTQALQFHQDSIGLPEDGAHNAPKHVGAR